MLKTELLELLKDVADDGEVNETIQGVEGLTKTFDLNSIGLDDFKNVLEANEIAKTYYQSSLDSGVGKGVAKYKENFNKNELPKLVEEAIKAKSLEGLTPDQKEIAELKAWKEQAEKEKADMIVLQENTTKLKNKGLDIELAKYAKSDEDIEFFAKLITNSVNNGVKQRLGDKDETPPKDEGLDKPKDDFVKGLGL